MDERIWRQVGGGAALIGLGLLLLGSQAGWYHLGHVSRLWPLALVVVGVRRGPVSRDGFLWIGWGGLLLTWTTGIWSIHESWPLFLVLHGVVMVFWPAGRAGSRRDGSGVG